MKILWVSFIRSLTFPLFQRISEENEVAIIVPSSSDDVINKYNYTIYNVCISLTEVTCDMTPKVFVKYKNIIEQFKPDIIHVHGTEKNLAQIQNYVKEIPVVVSIQGVLGGCLLFDNGFISELKYWKYSSLKNICGRGGYWETHKKWLQGSKTYERDILSKGKFFFCRTNWDRAWIEFSNPTAKIFQGEELLRNEFYNNYKTWSYDNCAKHSIFMPSGFNPIKGLHIAIQAIALLKKYYPDITLIVPGISKHLLEYKGIKKRIIGETYINYVTDLIKKKDVSKSVLFLDKLNGEEMVKQMKLANVFLSPSVIDNSPNVIGEAMMVGVPIVCSPVGGVPSFMKDEVNCLFAPVADPVITAHQIRRLFEDVNLANRLNESSSLLAEIRHNPQKVCNQYIEAYQNILRLNSSNCQK